MIPGSVFYKKAARILLVLIIGSICLTANAQEAEIDSQVQARIIDSSKSDFVSEKKDFVSEMKNFLEEKGNENISKFNNGTLALKQDELIENIKKTTQTAKNYLEKGVDTAGINTELNNILAWYAIAGDGVFTNKGSSQTYRNLSVTKTLLNELLNKVLKRKASIDKYEKDLANFRYRIDSLSADTALYQVSEDSSSLTQYLRKLVVAVYEVGPTDSSLKQSISNVQELQTKLNYVVNKLKFSLEEIETYTQVLSGRMLEAEFTKLWEPVAFRRPFRDILNYSKDKEILVLEFYTENNQGKLFLVFFLILLLTASISYLKRNLRHANVLQNDYSEALVFRHSFLSASIIILSVFQFIFTAPPFVFNLLFWIAASISLTIVFRGYISKFWMISWLILFFLFLLACIDNLILQASRPERWIIISIAVPGVLYGSYILLRGPKSELREKGVVYFIGFVVLLEAIAIITNIYGRFNLAKSLFVSGYINLVIAALFLYTARFISEFFSYAYEIFKHPNKKLTHIEFKNIDKSVPRSFYFFLTIGWFVLCARNFYAFNLISKPLQNFIFSERTIGNYSFSLSSILLFFLILVISMIASKIISYFASYEPQPTHASGHKKSSGVGSWILLVRIAIICLGVFLAFAAVGIPMERITIILGTLGVGIGFGLQALVNNLVSGLIISFEKPVNVGDNVEIAGQSGRMKSIGFRSSVISTWDGADVVIPNGDLLNAHLINWTLSRSIRRVNIIVGIAYGSDLSITKKILYDLLAADSHILKYPAPIVIFQQFNPNDIEVKVLFWVHSKANEWISVKSDVLVSIDTAFKNNGIVVPFPQYDVHIHPSDSGITKDKEP